MIYLLLVFQQFLASTTHIVAQDVTQRQDPLVVLLFRCSIASLALGVILLAIRKKNYRPIARRDWWRLAVVGMLNVPINQFLFLEGVKRTSPANSALLYALTPLFVFLLSLSVHRERANWRKCAGIAIALAGVFLVILERGEHLQASADLGNLLIFVAVIAWSLYTFLGKPLVDRYGAVQITAMNMIVGTLIYLPIGVIAAPPFSPASIAGGDWLRFVYLGLIASVANYLLWFYALGKLETTKVAIFQNLQPVMTIIMALLLGRAIMTGEFAAGGVMTLIGVTLVQLG